MADETGRSADRLRSTLDTVQAQQRTIRSLLLEKYEPIAIVGMGLRFPGGNETPADFADFLREGRSGIVPFPEDRWDHAAFVAQSDDDKGKIRAAAGGFLERLDLFDAPFFNISPKEAQYMDPQQRMLLETAWNALEHANIDPTPLRRGNGGVYVGASSIDYAFEMEQLSYPELDGHLASGVTLFPLSGRLSYFLGWRGPCMTLDTACASALTALHLAVDGLRRRECDIALAGGVNALHHPRTPVIFSAANMLAPDGRCKTFDEAADGYARGEGCGLLVLKRLSDAKRDGDKVLALIRGTAVGQDGDSAGFTVPNGTAQEAIMRAALSAGMLEPADIQYVEAHGTGTPLGDPIEIGAISDVFAGSHTPEAPVVVASVKTNVGHLEPVAGLVGVIKTVLQMQEGTFFPHLNLQTPSGRIPWDSYPVAIPTECRPWTADTRRAVVNSFGFGGTIAAAVVEQAPPGLVPDATAEPEGMEQIFTLSAKNRRSLGAMLDRYRQFVIGNPDMPLSAICYTANTGRAQLALRTAGVVRDHTELVTLLDKQRAQLERGAVSPGDARKVAMLFTGQGSQYPGMGSALYRQYPVFREHLDECDRLFERHLGRSIRALVLGEAEDADSIHQTRFTQPALFALEYSLAKLWLSWGARPTTLIGHSIGEVVAAAVAEAFCLGDAVTLVAARASLMQSVKAPGGMAAVLASEDEIRPHLEPYADVVVAAVNSPRQCVLSGGTASLAEASAALLERGLEVKQLKVSHAFHSPLMSEIFDDFRQALRAISFEEPRLTVISNLTGRVVRSSELSTPEYWVRHIGEPVNFHAGMQALERRGRHVFIEVGPGDALTALAKQCTDAENHLWVSSLHFRDLDGTTIRTALAQVYVAGLSVSWDGYHAGRPQQRVALPTYAFDRKRHWLPVVDGRHTGAAPVGRATHPLLGPETTTDDQRASGEREFRTRVSAFEPAYLRDHVAMGQVVFPGTGYIEILLALQDAVFGETTRPLQSVRIHEPLFLAGDQGTELRTRCTGRPDGTLQATVSSFSSSADGLVERLHSTAEISAGAADGLGDAGRELLARTATGGSAEATFGPGEIYSAFSAVGMDYGPEFQRVRSLTRYAGRLAFGDLRGHDAGSVEYLPPALLDGAMHALAGLAEDDGGNYLPVRFGSLRLFKKPRGSQLQVMMRLLDADVAGVDMAADLLVLEGDRPVVELTGLGLKRVVDGRRHFLHRLHWVKRSLLAQSAPSPRRVLVLGREQVEFAGVERLVHGADIHLSFAADAQMLAATLGDGTPTDVCWFWTSDCQPTTAATLRTECERNFRDLLDVLAVLRREEINPRVWLVTERGQWLPDDGADAGQRLAAATLWGFGQVLLNEHPAYRVTLVDLPADGEGLRSLVEEMQGRETGEFQVAYRRGVRHVRRLRPHDPVARGDDSNFALAIGEYGRFTGVRRVPVEDPTPTGDQIRVRVRAAGLNFKDVLNVLGMFGDPSDGAAVAAQAQPLGFECCGTVVDAGPDARFGPGDEVIVNHFGLMQRRVTVPSPAAVRKPTTVSFVEGAGLASAYVTAYYALHELAGIKPGDRILIHAAAGGVGQAAVQLAHQAGAEVFATASPHKWPLLHAQGVQHVMHSRTLDFAEEIERATGGSGVDIVLNSLNKEFIPAGLRSLAIAGRFVELGKVGVWSAERIRKERPDASYYNFDLSELPQEQLLRLNQRILSTVGALIEEGRLAPLPTTAYELDDVEEAFGVLGRGANIGKLVISFVDEHAGAGREVPIRSDRTYLITGGLGALGLLTAQKLVDLGARHIALTTRRAAPDAAEADALTALRQRAEVTVHRGDVGEAGDMARIADALRKATHPVGGIIHAAGALADAPVAAQTWETIDPLFGPKVYGSWLLHEVAGDLPELDFFVAFSSAASVVGGVTQSNYAAANAFQDQLSHWRSAQGLPSLAVNWGPWSEVGMSARLSDQHVRALEHEGIRFFTPARALRALMSLLGRPEAQVAGGECDWDRFIAAKPIVNSLYEELGSKVAEPGRTVDLEALRAAPGDERVTMVQEFVRLSLADVLHIEDVDDIDVSDEFSRLGLDSLVAVELKNTLENAFKLPLAPSIAFDHPTIGQLCQHLLELLADPDPAARTAA